MTILNIKIRNLTVIFLITSVLMSCVSYSKLTPSTQIINQNEDFTIEGKFKIKINSIQENGYFILKKQNSLINLTLGKNYLLPEKELNFQYHDLIFISELKFLLPPKRSLFILSDVVLEPKPVAVVSALSIVHKSAV